ncbi:sporulation integral membrane protein YtvI [Bacillus fonticola]|uniref:sporulation integral membrane protein YtvI n=1 Tax=Bacillus fonticola TaxID=2728853 RepID=UPI001475DCF2|nr:sporulation integral membrane protein YtvI [Bacillus fonticola]
MNSIFLHRFLRALLVVAIIVVTCVAFVWLAQITYPFLIAIVLAFLFNPIVQILEKRFSMPRSLAVILTMVSAVAILAGLITLFVAELVAGANYLSKHVPNQVNTLVGYAENFFMYTVLPFYNELTAMFESLDLGQQETILENIQNAGTTVATSVGNFIEGFFANIPSIIGWFPNAATVIVFSLLATFFISKDWDKLKNRFTTYIPAKAKNSGKSVYADLRKALFGFLRAQATLISLTAITILIGLLILRVEYAVTIALVMGLVDIVPYLGTGVIFIPWIAYEFLAGESSLAVGLTVLFVVTIVQRQVLEPKILSSSIGLDPLATLVALFIGFQLFGFLGLIVGPVVLVLFNTFERVGVFGDVFQYIWWGSEPPRPTEKGS